MRARSAPFRQAGSVTKGIQMSEQTQANNQQMIVYALIAIAVLLAVIVGFMIYQNVQGSAGMSTTTPPPTSNASDIAAKMPTAAQPVAFDPSTATKLPAGMTPQEALKTYMENVKAGKYAEAFELLPLTQKNSYGTADAYGEQLKAYGITGYKISDPTTNGGDVLIVSEQDTPAMNISYTWTYTKVGSTWYVKSREMGAANTPATPSTPATP
jgi:hypothetical protein